MRIQHPKQQQPQKQKIGKDYLVEGQVLNRAVRRTAEGLRLEADLRRAERIIEQLGLLDVKPQARRELKLQSALLMGDCEDVEEEELAVAEAMVFRAIAACCNCLQPERPDIQYAVKSCCR